MTDAPDFDWSHVAENVVQNEVGKVAIYSNPHGDVAIRQERQWDEEHDTWIIIARANAFAAARAILEAAGCSPRAAAMMAARPDIDWEAVNQDFTEHVVADGFSDNRTAKDRTAAERMRRYRKRKATENKARDDRNAVTDELELRLVSGE